VTTVLLIDLPSIVFPAWHMAASDPNPNAASIQSLDRIRGLAHGQTHVAIACDSKRSVRKDADPTYKANRKPEDRATLYHQMNLVIEALQAEGFPIWSADGFEADDIIASATAQALADPNTVVQIVSADKDLLALVGERVTLKSLKDGSVIDAAVVQQKFGVKPAQIPDYLALVGDASDNIKGAEKIGPVTAVKLLGAFGTLEGLYAALVENPAQFTPAIAASLTEFSGRVDTVRELIRLRADLPVPFEEIAVERPVPTFDFTPGDDEPDANPFSADTPTGLPSPPPAQSFTHAQLAPERAQVEAAVAVPYLPETPAPPAPAPARRGRPAKQPAVASDPAPTRPVLVDATPRVTVEELKVLQAEAAQAEAAKPERQNEAKPEPEEQRRKAPTMEPQTTALVPQVIDADYTRQLEPRTMTEAITLAKYAFDSRMFGAYGSAQSVLMTIMAGRELGMPTMHALRAFHVIEGRPVLAADAIRALVMRSGVVKYFRCIERTAERATFAAKRGDDPEIVLSYSISEAQAAGLVKPGSGWVKNPADLLVARAGSKLARLIAPDVVHGIYSPDEMEG